MQIESDLDKARDEIIAYFDKKKQQVDLHAFTIRGVVQALEEAGWREPDELHFDLASFQTDLVIATDVIWYERREDVLGPDDAKEMRWEGEQVRIVVTTPDDRRVIALQHRAQDLATVIRAETLGPALPALQAVGERWAPLIDWIRDRPWWWRLDPEDTKNRIASPPIDRHP